MLVLLRFGSPQPFAVYTCDSMLISLLFVVFQILAAVRVGLLAVAATSEQQQSVRNAVPDDVPALPVGAPGHADILREASHYLSAIKVWCWNLFSIFQFFYVKVSYSAFQFFTLIFSAR